jgi:GABA permease
VAFGGFAPNGYLPVLTGAVAATGFYFGAELVTLAAAEAAEPAKAIANATNSVIARVLIFYVGSILLIVAIVPWNRAEITTPYVSALKMMGVPAAAQIMNAVILTAVLSALNSGLYASSRILFALTKTGDAPSTLARVSRNGVPVRAILLGTVFGYGAILMSYISPDRVFAFLVNSYGTVALFVYLLIAVAHLRLRGRLERDKSHVLNAKMWGYPYLTYGAIIAMLTILTGMAFIPDQCLPLIMGVASLAAIALGYAVKRLSLSRPAARLTPPAGSHP